MIKIYPDLNALSRAAAAIFVEQASQAVAARGRFSVALSGGTTPQSTYELLAQSPSRDRVDWDKVHVFWGDERFVPLDDPRSNARMARKAWLDQVPLLKDQVHPIDCNKDPAGAAQEYEGLLRQFFAGEPPQLDLVFLGLGENGHTASLFPGTAVPGERQRWTAEVYVAVQNLYRVTLTPPLLNQARLTVFLVAGAGKAGVLREVLQSPRDPTRLPAQLIRPVDGELRWLVEEQAAAQLSRENLQQYV